MTAIRSVWRLARLLLSLCLAIPVMAASAQSVRSVAVIGTAFRVTFANGQVVAGRALQGATLSLAMPGHAAPQRIRLDRIVPDPDGAVPDLLFYRITVLPDRPGEQAYDLCEPDAKGERWAFPLKGQWDANGKRLSETGLTLACASGGAIGKCVRWGYRPWAKTRKGVALAPYYAACVNMVRANYCGNRGTTSDGMAIDLYDNAGVNLPDDTGAHKQGLRFEAAWTSKGALCVAHTRVPSHMTIAGLSRSCPRLIHRLGPRKCVEKAAYMAHYGNALIFNRSR